MPWWVMISCTLLWLGKHSLSWLVVMLVAASLPEHTTRDLLEYNVNLPLAEVHDVGDVHDTANGGHSSQPPEVRIRFAIRVDMLATVVAPNIPSPPPSEMTFRETLFDLKNYPLLRRGAWLFCRTPLDVDCRQPLDCQPEWRLNVAESSISGGVLFSVTRDIEEIEKNIGCSVAHFFPVLSWVTSRLNFSPHLWLDTSSWFQGEKSFVYTLLTTNSYDVSGAIGASAGEGMRTAPCATMACLCQSGHHIFWARGLLPISHEEKKQIEQAILAFPMPSEPFKIGDCSPKVYRADDFLFDLIEAHSESDDDESGGEE